MRTVVRLNAIVALVVCLVLMVIMITQLYTQAQLRGMLSGVRVRRYTVTQKWIQPSRSWRRSDSYWISWTNRDIHVPGNHRVGVTVDKWNKLKIGGPIDIAYASMDDKPYVRNDIYDSDGNIVLNIIFFLAPLGVAIWMLFVLFTPSKSAPEPPWRQY
jgi:hypothetical protein